MTENKNESVEHVNRVLFYLGALNVANEVVKPEVAAEIDCGNSNFDKTVKRVKDLGFIGDFDIKTETPKLTEAGFNLFKEMLYHRQIHGWY